MHGWPTRLYKISATVIRYSCCFERKVVDIALSFSRRSANYFRFVKYIYCMCMHEEARLVHTFASRLIATTEPLIISN